MSRLHRLPTAKGTAAMSITSSQQFISLLADDLVQSVATPAAGPRDGRLEEPSGPGAPSWRPAPRLVWDPRPPAASTTIRPGREQCGHTIRILSPRQQKKCWLALSVRLAVLRQDERDEGIPRCRKRLGRSER